MILPLVIVITLASLVLSNDATAEQLMDTIAPDSVFTQFMTQGDDPQIYVLRYENEVAYQEWFDTYFVGMTIQQAVGLLPQSIQTRDGTSIEPYSKFVKFMTQGDNPQIYVHRYEKEDNYRTWFDTYFDGITIQQAVGLLPLPTTIQTLTKVESNDLNVNTTALNTPIENTPIIENTPTGNTLTPNTPTPNTPTENMPSENTPTPNTPTENTHEQIVNEVDSVSSETPETIPDPGPFVADGKITLSGLPKIPYPDNLMFPLPIKEGERVLQRLADGIDDKLITPPSDETEVYFIYSTEKGHEMWVFKSAEGTKMGGVRYMINGKVPYEEREEFLRTFMNKAGLYEAVDHYLEEKYGQPIPRDNGGLHIHTTSVTTDVSGFLGKRVAIHHWNDPMELTFSGWVNHAESMLYMPNLETDDINDPYSWTDDSNKTLGKLNRYNAGKMAHDFHLRHLHLYDPEKCTIRPFNDNSSFAGIEIPHSNGILLYEVHVAMYKWNTLNVFTSFTYIIDAVNGELIWPGSDIQYCLVDDWIDKIDIPEYARVQQVG